MEFSGDVYQHDGGLVVEKKYKSKNLDAERDRRARLKRNIHALRALVPRITKMSKMSTLTDAEDYIRNLHGEIEDLQRELQQLQEERTHGGHPDNDQTKNVKEEKQESFACPKVTPEPDIQMDVDVSLVGLNRFHVKMVCSNKHGRLTDIVEMVSRLGLEITNVNFISRNSICQIMFLLEDGSDEIHEKLTADEVKYLLMKVV